MHIFFIFNGEEVACRTALEYLLNRIRLANIHQNYANINNVFDIVFIIICFNKLICILFNS